METDNSIPRVSKNPFLEIANLVVAQSRFTKGGEDLPGAANAHKAAMPNLMPNLQALSDIGNQA